MKNENEKKNKLKKLIEDRAFKLAEDMAKDRKVKLFELMSRIGKLETEIKANKKDVQKVEVINQSAIGDPVNLSWMPDLMLHAVKGVTNFFAKLWGEGLTVRLAEEERQKPIPVIVIDVMGRPVDLSKTAPVVIPMGGGASISSPYITRTVASGRKTVATPGTAVQLFSSQTPCRRIVVTAPFANTGSVYIGSTDVSAVGGSEKGILLGPTGSSDFEIDDVSKLWIDATVAGEGVTFSYFI